MRARPRETNASMALPRRGLEFDAAGLAAAAPLAFAGCKLLSFESSALYRIQRTGGSRFLAAVIRKRGRTQRARCAVTEQRPQ